MISSDRLTSESAKSKFLGVLALVRAQLYCVQHGLAQIASNSPTGNCVWSHVKISSCMSASVFGSMSRLTTSHPLDRNAFPIDPEPENNSRSFFGNMFTNGPENQPRTRSPLGLIFRTTRAREATHDTREACHSCLMKVSKTLVKSGMPNCKMGCAAQGCYRSRISKPTL